MIVAIAIFGACILGSNAAGLTVDATCNTKIQAFRDCHVKISEGRKAEAKTRDDAIQACYKTSGCTPAVEAPSADRQKFEACMKDTMTALGTQVKTCVQGKVTGLTVPDAKHDGGEHRGFGRHGDKEITKACGTNTAAVATVKTCIQQAHTNGQSGPDQEKARFDNNCKAKADCDTGLGADCKTKLDGIEQAMCECSQAAHSNLETVRSSTPSCASLPAPKGGAKGGQGGKQRSCDGSAKKDYCQLGYDAFQADKKANAGKRGGQ